MDKDTQLWHEYESLRSEIRNADTLNYQIIGIVVGAVALLLTTGFREPDPISRLFIFLCVFVVTIPAYRLLQGNRRRTWRISTYIQVFIESQLESIQWESRLQKQVKFADKGTRQFFSSKAGMNEWFIISVINTLASLLAVISGLLQIKTELLIHLGGIAIIGIVNLWICIVTSRQEKSLRRDGKIEQGYLQSWLAIRDEALQIKKKENTK
jgi:hypothetical protein